MSDKVVKDAAEWRQQLSPEQFRICRERGTEPAFSGQYCDEKRRGVYACVCCGDDLFASETKFDSGTGWPSFTAPVAEGRVDAQPDVSYGMIRTEVVCGRCDAHLGHVFEDGPEPTGLRYCLNSASLTLKPKD